MKIRNGFVSNSSSSNFVVAFPKNVQHNTEVQFTVKVDLDTFASGYLKTSEELDQYLIDEYGDNTEWWPTWVENAREAIRSDNYIICGAFANDNGLVEAILCEDGLDCDMNENMDILESEGGF